MTLLVVCSAATAVGCAVPVGRLGSSVLLEVSGNAACVNPSSGLHGDLDERGGGASSVQRPTSGARLQNKGTAHVTRTTSMFFRALSRGTNELF